MSEPLEREAALAGFTYKLKWPGSDHAIYVTINDIERDGRRRPFEIFINTKNLEHYAWTVALTRMISAVFRRGGDVSFVVEELKAVFDPQGGRWVGGRYVPSLLAAIGEIIEQHMLEIGFLQASEPATRRDPALAAALGAARAGGSDIGRLAAPMAVRLPDGAASPGGDDAGAAMPAMRAQGSQPHPQSQPDPLSRPRPAAPASLRNCPRCLSPEYVREEGCWVCRTCGYSRCG